MAQKDTQDLMDYIKLTPLLIGFIFAIGIDLSFRSGGLYNIALAMLIGGTATGYMINGKMNGILINCGILGFALGIILAIFNIIQYSFIYASYQIPISDFMSGALGTVVTGAIVGVIIGVIGGVIGAQINKNTCHVVLDLKSQNNQVKNEKTESENEKKMGKQVQKKVETSVAKKVDHNSNFNEKALESQVKTPTTNSSITNSPKTNSNTKDCPHCKSQIPVDASKCRYCGESVELSGVKLAGVGTRFAALFIDSIIIVLFWAISTYLVNFTVPVSQTYGSDGSSTSLLIFPIYTIILFAYYILLEGPLGNGQTVGKKILKIRVVKLEDQSTIDYGVSFIRNILRVIDGLFLYFVGFLSIQGSDKKQRLGDKAAKTIVIKI